MKPISFLVLAIGLGSPLPAAEPMENARWDPAEAAEHLDARAAEWKGYSKTVQADGTSCISCHSGAPYLFVRPLLREALGDRAEAKAETALLADITARVSGWNDAAPWYAFDDQKKKESRGTEAVLNFVVLALRDQALSRKEPEELTRKALENLWGEQRADGGFSWFHFGLAPWESDGSDVFGASLALVAASSVGAEDDDRFGRLESYLRWRSTEPLDLHSRIGLLWASSIRKGLLPETVRKAIVEGALSAEQPGGGFRLGDLGPWKRKNDTPDAYATGLVVYVLGLAGDAEARPAVERGIGWLASHQDASGGWRAESPNKDRSQGDPMIAEFLSDAGSAFAVLALSTHQGR